MQDPQAKQRVANAAELAEALVLNIPDRSSAHPASACPAIAAAFASTLSADGHSIGTEAARASAKNRSMPKSTIPQPKMCGPAPSLFFLPRFS